MLTLKTLNELPKGCFETGVDIDNQDGINMSGSNEMLRWVAVRGAINDWAIYVGRDDQTVEMIMDFGDKAFGEHMIKKLVPCDDEAFNRYRY
jgi:hypothetical protein